MESSQSNTYALLDSGRGEKLERFGRYVIRRPCAQAIWERRLPAKAWEEAHAFFTREKGNRWVTRQLPAEWEMAIKGVRFRLHPTEFGHLGIFPEHEQLWGRARDLVKRANAPVEVLNLFAYTGGATLALAAAGAKVCHVDASQGVVKWARENAALNKLETAPIRWIIDDVQKFLRREKERGRKYHGVILDPPTFGRGANGELFKIEEDLVGLLQRCRQVLHPEARFFMLSSHTPGLTPLAMRHILGQTFSDKTGAIETGEMMLQGADHVLPIPSGSYACWVAP